LAKLINKPGSDHSGFIKNKVRFTVVSCVVRPDARCTAKRSTSVFDGLDGGVNDMILVTFKQL